MHILPKCFFRVLRSSREGYCVAFAIQSSAMDKKLSTSSLRHVVAVLIIYKDILFSMIYVYILVSNLSN